MGVHGLWELLAPVGRRVSVETLAGKKLAIDASIWMIQFMKAMRDEKGEMVRNAHILGFFRRICKLLYLRTKPVFVFDGGTPALKRRTVIARRRQRENAQAKIRKTAEKLLLNHLKAMRLKELAADLEKQRQVNDSKGKKPIVQEPCNEQETQKGNDDASISYNQEELDEMLAASIAAEENEHFSIGASTSGAGVPDGEVLEEDDDEDEEMIIPEMHGKVDPAVLAALPPSMQLDLLVQMRERLMAENRQKYQKVKKAPARFSELQIEAYLKTVAFRREIDGVQKSAAGRGIGGVQTSRIASEANREFIFSSSFTGNKGALTSVGQERNGAEESQPPPVNSSTNAVNKAQQTKRSDAAAGSAVTETGRAFHDEVETYLDERGRVRVSRVRALGIRMTRDLQRNLDLMKEIDLEKAERNQEENNESANARKLVDVPDSSSARIQHREATDKNDGMNTEVDKTEEPAVANGASIEISFEDTSEHREYDDNDDELFAHLVAGEPVMDFSFDKSATSKQSFHSSSDNEWEEGVIEGKSTDYLSEGGTNDEGEVEWEEGFRDIQLKSSSCPDESRKTVTKGALEEEAAFQEAIRRSLEDTRVHRSMDDLDENQTSERTREMVIHNTDCVSICEGKEGPDVETLGKVASQSFGSMDNIDANCAEAKSVAFMELNLDKSKLDLKLLNQDIGESGALAGEILVASGTLPGAEGLHMTEKQPLETYSKDGNGLVMGTYCEKVAHNCRSSAFSSAFTDSLHERLLDSHSADAQCMSEAELDDHFSNTEKPGRTSADDSVTDVDGTKELAKDKIDDNFMIENLSNDRLLDSGSADALQMIQAELDDHFCNTEKPGKISADDSVTDVDGTNELAKDKLDDNFPMEKDEVMRNDIEEHEIMEDHLEEEMLFLGKEREELGTEQRKLERDAESVSNEMFAECQELLQMFGLPYIIAPMEAEAQCAFMELSNLVDGVVTDDSDAFLFGAQSVYKNIFDDRKYVETYLMKDIENELGLDREKLIHMALLLGSDYTEGISGVGIVNAIEVVNAFPGKEGLHEFREWIESPDPSILGKLDIETGGNSRKKGSKGTENIMSGSSSSVEGISFDEMGPQLVDDAKRRKQIFMDKHRNVSKNWHISPSFPSDAVISAYASPQVDKSTEPFSWGKPDLFALRKLCWEKFGWGASKADELLLPVLKEYNKHETQLRLEAFYTFNERFAKIRSKRIKKAVKGITGSKSSALMDETPEQSRSGKKRKVKPFEDEGNQSGVDSTRLDGAGSNGQGNTMEKPTVKQSKRGQTKEKNSQRKESHEGGRHRGRGRRQPSGRGRRKNNSYADTETGYDDASCSENDEEMQFHISDEARQVRRSGRLRKTVNYTVSDEFDNSEESENFLEEGLVQTDSFVGEEVGGIEKSNMNSVNEGGEVRRRNGALVGAPERTQRTDKMSTGLIDDGEMDDPSDQGQASKDNLQFGGGLCLDEGSNVRTGGGSLVEETEQTHRMDKMSTGLIDDCEVDDPSNQGQASKDYLQFGGGFCLDEDEEKEFDGHASSPIRKTIPNEFNILTGADSVVDENRGSNPSTPRRFTGEMILSDNEQSMNDKTSRSDYSSPDRYNAENELENCNPKFLRAMPNLIRKRRKN